MVEKNIKILTWFNFFTDFKLYAPIAIIYFSNVSGSFALGMSVFSVATLASAFFEIPTGILSDFIGRKKTVLLGAGAAVFYSLFYALGQSYWTLIVGALFEGLSRSFYSGNNDALLHDTLTESKQRDMYAHYLGKTSAMFQIALALSAILGGFIADWSFSFIMWLSIIPQVICFILSIFLKEPSIHKKTAANIFIHLRVAFGYFLSHKKLRLLSLSSIATSGLGEAGYVFQSAFYVSVWPLWAIGIAKALSNIGAATSFHFSDALLKKFGAFRIFVFENIYNRVVNSIATFFPTLFSPILMSTTSLLFGVSTVTRSSLLQKEYSHNQRATMGSLNSFAGSIFFAISAYSLGAFADVTSPASAYLILQLFQLTNLILYWKIFRKE